MDKSRRPYVRPNRDPICDCGSGKEKYLEVDARNIPLCYVCDDCKERKLKTYRPEVLTDPNYETDEPIDPED